MATSKEKIKKNTLIYLLNAKGLVSYNNQRIISGKFDSEQS